MTNTADNLLTIMDRNDRAATVNILSAYGIFSRPVADVMKFYMLYYGAKKVELGTNKLEKLVQVLSGLVFSGRDQSKNQEILAELIYDVRELDIYRDFKASSHDVHTDSTDDKKFIANAIDVLSKTGDNNSDNLLPTYMGSIYTCESQTDWTKKFPVEALVRSKARDRVKSFLIFVINLRRKNQPAEWIANRMVDCIPNDTFREDGITYVASLAYEISIATETISIGRLDKEENSILSYVSKVSKLLPGLHVIRLECFEQFCLT